MPLKNKFQKNAKILKYLYLFYRKLFETSTKSQLANNFQQWFGLDDINDHVDEFALSINSNEDEEDENSGIFVSWKKVDWANSTTGKK